MPEKNIMTIHVGPTGRKVFTDNLEMNQNSSNNVLELFCEGKYEFVQVFYTFPDGKTTYKHHMIPDGYDKDKASYKFHDNIDKAVTSFVIPNVTANLKVSFIGYYKNDLNQYTPVGINDFLITVIRVNNNEVYDQTYNGSDVVNIWKNINNLNALLVDLNPDYKPTTLEDLKATVQENYNELNTRLDSVPTVEDVYNKEDINQMFGIVYKYGGSVDNFSDLPTNLTNEQTGVVINVRNPNGMNYVWTGSEWDALGGFDETKYYKKDYIDEVIRATQLKAENETAAVDNKVNTLSATHTSDTTALRNDIAQINAQFSNYYNKSDIDGKVSEVTTSVSELSTRVDGIETSANNYTDQKVGALTQTFNNYTSTTNSRINQLESKVTSVYTLKGSCTYEELTAKTENSVGDVWNVTDKDSQNYVWTGSEWDTLGSVADFSEYAKTSEVTAQIEAAENRLNGTIETTFNGLNTELQALTATVSTNKTSTETAISNLSNDTVHVNTFEAFKTSNNAAISAVDTRVTNLTSSVNTALTGKANASDVYTKNETDNAISTSINALIDGAPDTLDTLKELADAVNSNKSLVETLNEAITNKQDTLVSGTNIKTVNGVSILGTGNIAISGGTGIDDSTISTSSTYSSSKIDSTYLKAPEGRLDIENGRVNLKNNINSAYSITNNEVVMELNDDGLSYHDNATNREVNITPYYGAIDQTVDPATIKVNGIGLARETDLNKKVSLRGDTMTGNLNAPAFTVDSTKVAAGDKPLIDGAINFKYKNTNDEASNAWLTMLPSGQLQFGSQGAVASEIGTVATQEWVNKKITNAYIYKGSVDTYDALPSGADPGFVYNVRSNGANYAWTGTEWDELGATVNLDVYALKTDLNGKQDTLVSGTNIKTINGESILGNGNITISSETVGSSVGYYDTISKNSDGTYTITRQTGYILLDGVIEKNASIAANDNGTTYRYTFDIVNGSGQNGDVTSNLLTKILFSDLVGGRTGIAMYSATRCSICIPGITKLDDYKAHLAKNNIYVQYKLATATTEKVEKKHYARYNERFILEHNKNEAERSANLWDEITESGTLSGDDGSLENNSARLRSKNFIPISGNTKYIFNKSYVARINFYDDSFNFISTWVNNKTAFITPSNAHFIKFDINSDYGTTYKHDIILNKGNVALQYQPYEGKVLHEKDLKNNSSNYVTLGYYDTITENSDGTYTITRQTGFRNISTDLIEHGAYRPTQAGHGEYGADTGIHNLPIASGSKNFINNLLTVRDNGEIYSGSTGISITENGMCWVNLGDNYTTTEQYREYFAKNNIYVQYKLATATTEKVEEKHYARYNERFILEHNRIEAEKSANVFDINIITIGNGYDYTATATDWIKAIDIPVEPNTTYTASYPISKYAFNHGNIVSDYNKNTITTGSDTRTLSLFMYVGDYSGTVNAWFSNYMFNEGPVALPYQPYKGKVIHEKDLKNVSTNLGYYDTITENADGTYTITKQTGYINGKDFLNRSVNGVGNPYVTFEHVKVNKNIENIIGNCSRVGPDSWWNSTFTQVTITYDSNYDFLIILLPNGTAENDLSPLNDIHIQYKLPNTRTEIVEKNYCAQYNKRFILEHNKREAAKSSNLWSYENNITINAGSEKWWTLSNATMDAWGLVVGETYSIKSFVNNYTKDLAFQILPGWADFRDGRTFVFTNDTQIRIGGNTVASPVTFTPKIMLVKGIDIADEYQPYSGAPVHKKEFDDFKNSMKFIPYISYDETGSSSSKDIETNGTYFVIPTDPSNASIKLEVKAGTQGTLQTAYFSGGIISVYRNYDRRFQVCEVKIVYGAGSTAASTFISDGHNYSSLPSGILSRITGKCKIYKLI